MFTVKALSNTFTLGSTANTISNAKVVYIVNANTTTAAQINVSTAAPNVNTQITIPPNSQIALMKLPADTLSSNLTSLVFASAIAFTN